MSQRHPVPLVPMWVRAALFCAIILVLVGVSAYLAWTRPPLSECWMLLPVYPLTALALCLSHRTVGQPASATVSAKAAGSLLSMSHDDKAAHTPVPKPASRRKAS
jgi:hypothetical protein